VMVSIAAVASLFLPSTDKTIYFHRTSSETDEGGLVNNEPRNTCRLNILKSFKMIFQDCYKSMKKPYVLKWSLWWALSMCGNFQVGNYIQPLWMEVLESTKGDTVASQHFNGAVEAATTLTGAFLAFIMGFMHFNWSLIGENTIAVISIFDGLVLYLMAEADNIWVAYVGYLLFRALFQMMITVASFEVASHISQDCYGVVFGFNTFLALSFQTILTSIVASSSGLALPAREQFLVYAGYFYVVGSVFMIVGMIEWCRNGSQRYREEGIWISPVRRGSTTSTRIDPPVGSTETPQ